MLSLLSLVDHCGAEQPVVLCQLVFIHQGGVFILDVLPYSHEAHALTAPRVLCFTSLNPGFWF